MTRILAALGLSVLIAGAFPHQSVAQTTRKKTNTKTITIINKRASPTVSMSVENASIRQALARLFYASNRDFVFEGNMPTGLVTTKIRNQPFETALRLILESSDVPMTYSKTGDVYLIRALRPRPVRQSVAVVETPVPVSYVDDGWGNTIPVNPVPPGAPATVGVQIGPNGVGPNPNIGGIQFGAPIGGPPVMFSPFGFGFPTGFNTGGFGFPVGFNGGLSFPTNFGFGNFGFPVNGGFGNSAIFIRP